MARGIVAIAVTTCLLFAALVVAHGQLSPAAKDVYGQEQGKGLWDDAMKAMAHSKYSVARTRLATLMESYPDSGYVPRAKLAIADAWYAEGNLQKAEVEYQDFLTFFPKRPEIVHAQSRIDAIRKALRSSQ